MLYILFSSVVLLPVFAAYGAFLERFKIKFFEGISAKIITGILSINLLYVFVAFFLPLNNFVEISLVITGFALFFYLRLWKDFWIFLKKNHLLFLIFTATTLLFGSFHPFILDHFGYYVPTIKWLSEIGLVKGISNLDLLLGQMSFWHFLQAGLSNFSDVYLKLNAILMVIYVIYILEKKSWLHFIFFPILLLFTQSPSPDLPSFVFSLIFLNEILSGNKKSTLLFTLSIFIFAIKPTMVWVPIFALLYSFFILKSNLKFLIFGSVIFLLFILKNLFTFGFPIFPVSLLDFNLAWKPNSELLKISSEVAIQKTYDMQYSVFEIRNFSTWSYIKNWLFLSGIKSIIHCAFVLAMAVFTIFTFNKKSKVIYILWFSILIKSILTLLFSAQYRFFIDVFFVVFFVLFYRIANKKFILNLTFILISFSLLILIFPKLLQTYLPSFKLGGVITGLAKNQWLKPAGFQLNKFKTYEIGNLKFNVVKDYPFSFDTPIPAISPGFLRQDFDAGIFPQMISGNLKDGFIWRKLTVSERAKLAIILKEVEQTD